MKNLLYISPDKIKSQKALTIINNNAKWFAIAAHTEVDAIRNFLNYEIAMVIFAYDVKKDMLNDLSGYYRKIDPTIIVLEPYGGGTGLLEHEINQAFEENNKEAIT